MTIKKVFSFFGTSFSEGDVLEVTVKGKARKGDGSPWLALDTSDLGEEGHLVLLSGRGVTSVNRVDPPPAVGDRIWHKTAQYGASSLLVAIADVNGEPYAVFEPFSSYPPPPNARLGTMKARPLSEYVRAK